mgnify:FL=1
MPTPRVAAIHDLSCFGRCSLTIALPVLSAMGCQCCPLPTALLSAHTGFTGGSFLDLTEEMQRIADHWAQIDIHFDGIYSGFLGSAAQIGTVQQFITRFRGTGLVVIDPVLGDHGQAYRTCTPELCNGMRRLAESADIITPNLTEASLLLEQSYETIQAIDPAEIVRRLSLEGRRSVVLTGYSTGDGQTGALCFDRADGSIQAVQVQRVPRDFSGTGDLFTSVLTGAMVKGVPLIQAARTAADFVQSCAARTLAAGNTDGEGVDFEPLLGTLTNVNCTQEL